MMLDLIRDHSHRVSRSISSKNWSLITWSTIISKVERNERCDWL